MDREKGVTSDRGDRGTKNLVLFRVRGKVKTFRELSKKRADRLAGLSCRENWRTRGRDVQARIPAVDTGPK